MREVGNGLCGAGDGGVCALEAKTAACPLDGLDCLSLLSWGDRLCGLGLQEFASCADAHAQGEGCGNGTLRGLGEHWSVWREWLNRPDWLMNQVFSRSSIQVLIKLSLICDFDHITLGSLLFLSSWCLFLATLFERTAINLWIGNAVFLQK